MEKHTVFFSEVGAELRKQTRDGEVAGEPQEKGARSSRSLPVKSPGNMPEVSVLSEQKKKKKKPTLPLLRLMKNIPTTNRHICTESKYPLCSQGIQVQ